MIRINLLAIERDRARKRIAIPVAQRVSIAAGLILVGTAILIGWWFWSLRQESARLDEEIAAAEIQTRQIRSVLEQVRQFESQKALLQQRVSLIEELRKGQSAPVHLLDEISKSLPDRLWLNDLTQSGSELTISGVTDSLTAVSDFVANLEDSRWFRRPVEIGETQVQTDAQTGDVIRFQVKAQYEERAGPRPAVPVESAAASTAGGQ